MCFDVGIVVEGHAGDHAQVVALTIFVEVGRGALGDLVEDVDRLIVFVGLRLHKEAVARDVLAVQCARARHGTHTRSATSAIL